MKTIDKRSGKINRALKYDKLIDKYAAQRKQLKHLVKHATTPELQAQAMFDLNALPVNSSAVRRVIRCPISGFPRVMKLFGVGRHVFKMYLLKNNLLPGIRKV
jgi:ribosomal protein S14